LNFEVLCKRDVRSRDRDVRDHSIYEYWVHQRWQFPTARKNEWWPATTDSLPQAVACQHWYTLL